MRPIYKAWLEMVASRGVGWILMQIFFGSHWSFWPHLLFLTKYIWKSKVPSKLRFFVWIVVLNRVNINELPQIRRPHEVLSPNVYVLCLKDDENHSHMFLRCPVARDMWSRLLAFNDEYWVLLLLVEFLLIGLVDFVSIKTKEVYGNVYYSLFFCVYG